MAPHLQRAVRSGALGYRGVGMSSTPLFTVWLLLQAAAVVAIVVAAVRKTRTWKNTAVILVILGLAGGWALWAGDWS